MNKTFCVTLKKLNTLDRNKRLWTRRTYAELLKEQPFIPVVISGSAGQVNVEDPHSVVGDLSNFRIYPTTTMLATIMLDGGKLETVFGLRATFTAYEGEKIPSFRTHEIRLEGFGDFAKDGKTVIDFIAQRGRFIPKKECS